MAARIQKLLQTTVNSPYESPTYTVPAGRYAQLVWVFRPTGGGEVGIEINGVRTSAPAVNANPQKVDFTFPSGTTIKLIGANGSISVASGFEWDNPT